MRTLTNQDLITRAPSIAAEGAYATTSDRYSFVPTLNAVNFLRDAGWLPVMVAEMGTRIEAKKGYQKHMIRFSREDLLVGDERLDLLMYNSHDGGSAFQLMAGVFRFVCSNGMVVGDNYANFCHKHMGFDPDKFIESATAVSEQAIQIGEVVEDWKAIELNPDEQGAYAAAALPLAWDENKAPVPSTKLLRPRRWQDQGSGYNRPKSDLWHTFNTVQENVLRGGLYGKTTTGRRTRTRAVKSIDRDKKLNKALWTLTEKMAELKSA